jgi:hypothetical protein
MPVTYDNPTYIRRGRGKSPIISPDLDSKPSISRTGFSTLIPRGKHRDRKRSDKPIIRPFSTDEARIQPRQKQVSKK